MLTKTKRKIKKNISLKTHLDSMEDKAVKEFISKLKSILKHELLTTVLFGSKVRGTSNEESDIDILIVLKTKNSAILNQIIDVLVDIQLKYNANISPLIYSDYEFKMNREMGSYFIKEIESEGISL